MRKKKVFLTIRDFFTRMEIMNNKKSPIGFEMEIIKKNIIKIVVTRVWIDQEDNETQAELFYEKLLEILNKHPQQQYKLLGDIRKNEGPEYQKAYHKERIVYEKMMKLRQLEKIAVITNLPFFIKIGEIIALMAGRSKNTLKFFKNEEEAENWLEAN